MGRKTGAEVLVECLQKEGVRKVFGLSGHGLTMVLEALRTNKSGIQFVSARHEESAAHMADGWARVTGDVGVCCSTVGPGAVNLAAGLAEAYADSIPVLAITANIQSYRAYPFVGSLEDMDSLAFYAPITKWNAVVHDWQRIPELIQRAFREATTGRPGPVHVDIPLDLLAQTGEAGDLASPESYRAGGRSRGGAGLVQQAVELVRSAERPLLVAGGGVIASGAWDEFRSLAETLDVAATTTPMGSGCLPTDRSRFFGDGGWLGGNGVLKAMAEADVLLAVGCHFSSWLGLGTQPVMAGPPQQRIVHVDIDPREIGKNVGVSLGIVGDAKAVLADMLAVAKEQGPAAAGREWRDSLVGAYQAYLAGLVPMLGGDEGPITQGRLAKEVGEFLSEKDYLVAIDGGNVLLWAFPYIHAQRPRQRFFFAGGGHLGCGQPFANALKLAHPERPVVNFCGDGAFGMTIAELDTAVRHKLSVVNVVNNDGGWGMCKTGQLFLYGPEACDGVDQDFGPLDYAAIARGFGAYGERVESVAEIRPALERAFASGGPAVLDVLVQPVPQPMFGVMAAVVLQGCEMPLPAGAPPM